MEVSGEFLILVSFNLNPQDSFYGNFNKGRRPSQDTAWGRRCFVCGKDPDSPEHSRPRVFDQYEIDIEMTKHRHSYINSGKM